MRNQNFPVAVIWVTALTYAGFAVWLGTQPEALLEAFGIQDRTAEMATEIRAFYGGVELGIAAAMLWLLRRGSLIAALVIGALPLTGAATGRCIGMVVDGFSVTHAMFAGLEWVGSGVCYAAILLLTPQTSDGGSTKGKARNREASTP